MSHAKGDCAKIIKHSKKHPKIIEQINTIGITNFKEKVRKKKIEYREIYS